MACLILPAAYQRLPEHLRRGMRNYIEHRLRPGGFLSAVLSGELYTAVASADEDSRAALCEVVFWIVEWAPEDSYGSRGAIESWLRGIASDQS